MPTWEEAQEELINNDVMSNSGNTAGTMSWESAASELANNGIVPSPKSTWNDANNSIPAFMNKAPVAEGGIFRGHGATGIYEDPSLIEQGWDTFKRISGFGGKAIWKGLGIVVWPLERIEYTMATPIVAIQEEKPIRKMFIKGEGGAKEASDKVINRTIEALKSWIPGRPVPEEAKTWNDMWGNYYETLIGEPAPDYYKWTMGGITGFVVDPAVQAKMFKVVKKPLAKPLAELKETLSPQVWKRLKLTQKAQTGERVERAKEIGQSMAKKDLQIIAKELSKRTGKPVSTKAVQERLAQIIKGGITEQPELAKIANPVISEFQNNLKALRELNVKGMAGKQVFTEKLTQKQMAVLQQRKAALQTKLDKLTQPAYQKSLLKLANKLKVSGKESIEKNLLDLGESIEAGDVKYIDKLAKLLNISEKNLAKVKSEFAASAQKISSVTGKTGEQVLKIRQKETEQFINKIISIASKIEKQKINKLSPLIMKILNPPKGMTSRQYANREAILRAAEKLGISGKESIINDLVKFGDAIEKGDIKYIKGFISSLGISEKTIASALKKSGKILQRTEADIGKSAESILKLREKEGQQIVNKLLDIAGKTEAQKVKGLKPLLNKIFTMKNRFAGRQAIIDKTLEQIQDINNSIHVSDIFGGTEYFPRMYATKELSQKTPLLVRAARRVGIRAKYLTKRRNLPFEVRKELGEITTAQYPVVKRLIQQAADIETAKLLRSVAENPNIASKIALGNRKLIPDNPEKYGALANMFVHPKVHSDVMEIGRVKGNVEQVYDEAISMWKLFKVAWSPGAHFRNKFGNSILKSLSGMTEQDKIKYGAKAWKELKNNSIEYQTAKKFLKPTTFAGEEMIHSVFKEFSKPTGGILKRTYNKMRKIVEAPGKGYQALEFHDKFTLYLKARNDGKSVIEAVEHTNKWLFDYGDLAVWEKNIARRIMPFYTFPRKALPRVMEAAVENPYALYKYPLMAKMATQYSLYKLNMKDDDYKKLQQVLPEYMKQGSYVLMPYRDKNGDLRFFDWTYILPWGEMVDASDRGLLQTTVTNPLFALVSDIQHNKSTFTGREIWKETDTTEEKTWKSTEYIWKALVPSMSFKGIYWDKMYRAATGKTMYGKKELIPETIAHTIFGIRLQSLDKNLALRRKMYGVQSKLRELQGKMMTLIRKQNDKEITPQEANELRTQYMQQIQNLINKDIKGE